MPDTTRPTLAERLIKAIRSAVPLVRSDHEVARTANAVLGVMADTGSPLTKEQVAEIERDVDRDHKVIMVGIDPMYPECKCGLALPCCDGDTIRLLLAAYMEVDAHRCVLADRIAELERHLAMASEAQTRLGDRNAALDRSHAELRRQMNYARDALGRHGRDAMETTGELADGIDADRRTLTAERDGLAARVAELEAFVRKPGDFDDYLRWCREVAREDADRIENERLADGGEL